MDSRSLTLLSLCACASLLTVRVTEAQDDIYLPQMLREYQEDLGNLKRFYNITMSQEDRERLADYHRSWQKRLEGMGFDALAQDSKIDYLLFRQYLGFALRQLDYEGKKDDEVRPLIPFADAVEKLVKKRRDSLPIDSMETAEVLDKIATEAKTLTARHEKEGAKEMTAVIANRTVQRLRALQSDLRRWNQFYDGYDPMYTWWNAKAYSNADEAVGKYAMKLQELYVGDEDTVVGDPIGREALLDSLANEWIPYSPEELIAIAEKEYAWCERELKKASNEMGFADDWRSALEQVKALHVPPGEQPSLIKALAEESIQFLEKRDLVTIPPVCKETWRMEMMSPERQKVNPYFTGGEVISVSYPTSEMDYADKLMSLRGNNRHFCRATVHHELIPGHHLQLYMSERYRPYRQLFSTPFFVEGWALHWEMLLWDLEFQKSAEDRMGMLFWRTHRCARIIFSLSFHLGKMTAKQAIDYLVEKVGHERRNATAEVRRSVKGDYDPLYQAAYMLGGLQIRAMYQDMVTDGEITPKAFHDALLRENSIPIELIRASLAGQSLAEDFKSTWRFYPIN